MTKNWKTTSAGITAAIAGITAAIALVMGDAANPDEAWDAIRAGAEALFAIAAGLGLLGARDAKPTDPPVNLDS